MNDWTEKQSDNNANPSFHAHFFPRTIYCWVEWRHTWTKIAASHAKFLTISLKKNVFHNFIRIGWTFFTQTKPNIY